MECPRAEIVGRFPFFGDAGNFAQTFAVEIGQTFVGGPDNVGFGGGGGTGRVERLWRFAVAPAKLLLWRWNGY